MTNDFMTRVYDKVYDTGYYKVYDKRLYDTGL